MYSILKRYSFRIGLGVRMTLIFLKSRTSPILIREDITAESWNGYTTEK